MSSIRKFLVIVLLATVTLINFLAALHGYRSSLAAADNLFDSELLQLASVLAAGADPSPPAESALINRTRIQNIDNSIAYQVWREGDLTLSSDNAPDQPMAPLEAGFHDVNFGQYRWRVAVVNHGQRGWTQVAERIDRRFTLAENIIIESVLPIVACLPLIGILIWWIVSRGLQPLQQLAGQLEKKRPEDLSPVNNVSNTVELTQLVESINDLLSRLAGAFEREQRFAANAAHELRTPLSVLKVQLYNLKQELGVDNATLGQMKHSLDRLSHLVEQILTLHQSSQERDHIHHETVDLVALCQQIISENYSIFELKHQTIELDAGSVVHAECNRGAVETLLSNLLTNAGKYSPVQGRIRVNVRSLENDVLLSVEDSGPGIPADERHQVFERFYRIGGDRHDSGETGCGLGLSIAKQIVDAHRGTIGLDTSPCLGGLRVTVKFGRYWDRS